GAGRFDRRRRCDAGQAYLTGTSRKLMSSPAGIPTQNKESFRDSIATVDREGKRRWLYPTKPRGKLYRWRSHLTWVYLLLFFGLPFIKVDEEPLFLLNVVE